MNEEDDKYHYYAFCFMGTGMWASTYIGYKIKDLITLSMIQDAKVAAKISQDSVLVSISYLGHMTHKDFTEECVTPLENGV
jgi:hypothetical protein